MQEYSKTLQSGVLYQGFPRRGMISWQLWRSNLRLAISFPLVSSPCSRRSSRRHICSLSSVSGSIASNFSLFTSQISKRYIKQVKYCSIRLLDCHKADSRIQRASMAIEDDKTGTEVDETISEAGLVRSFQIVVAATRECGIGKDGKLPWNLPSELKFFKKITSETVCSSKKNAVIMGRRTWESIPPKFRPLSGRLNVVLSRNRNAIIEQEAAPADLIVSKSFRDALQLLATSPYTELIESVFVIGGEQLFREAMSSPSCDAIHWTEIESTFQCDTFVPAFDCSLFRLWYASSPKLENNTRFVLATYVRTKPNCDNTHAKKENVCKNDSGKVASFSQYQFGSETFSRSPTFIVRQHEEFQYLSLIEDIIKNGVNKGDRTGTGTFSKFGCQMRFNLRKSFPLFTTKRVFWRGVVEELLWFISGSTNAKVLQDKGINIWNGNASREYLDRVGLQHREEGDLGPVYGFQWRHFGAKYVDMHTDYSGQGVDQLANVIQTIKSNPNDRRIVLSAWNPADLQLMALPPCHMFAQFYVANGELSCQMYQRSCDVGLGVPFNVASYSLLTCIIAHVCDLLPGDFVHVLGDAHVYKNHVEPLQEQLLKVPKPFPTLRINTPNMDINSFKYADFKLIGYESHERIAMKMAV